MFTIQGPIKSGSPLGGVSVATVANVGLGINTSAPQAQLSLFRESLSAMPTYTYTNTNDQALIRFFKSSGDGQNRFLDLVAESDPGTPTVGSSIRLLTQPIGTANVFEAMRVHTNGFVGIGSAAPQAILDVASIGTSGSAIIIPRDSTGNRPIGVNGMLRYNTSSNVFEGFANNVWGTIASGTGSSSLSSIASGTGLLGGPITTSGTLSVDVGTGPNKIVQENANAQIAQSAGSVALPSYAFASYLNTGLANTGSSQLALVTNGTAALTVAATGYVGIGTTAPSAPFQVASGASAMKVTPGWGTSGTGTWIDLDTLGPSGIGTGGPGQNAWISYSAQGGQWFAGSAIGDVNYRNANGTAINLGIDNNGSATPLIKLTSGRTYFTSGLVQTGAGIPFYIDSPGVVGGRLSMLAGGNLGVGTTAPQSALDVVSVGTSSAIIVPRDTTGNRPTGVNGMLRYNLTTSSFEGFQAGTWTNLIGGGAASVTFPLLASPGTTSAATPSYSFTGNATTGLYSPSVGAVAIATNGTSALSIDSNQRVAIGTTNAAARLTVAWQSGDTQPTAYFGSGNGGNNMTALSAQTWTGRAIDSFSGTGEGVHTTSNDGTALFAYSSTGRGVYAQSDTSNSGYFRSNTNTNPSPTLVVQANGNQTSDLQRWQTDASAPLMVVQSTGMVGIGTGAPKAGLDVATSGSSSAIIVPRDTAANRPTPVNGMLRYNTDAQAMEAYVNGAWMQITMQPTGSVQPVSPSGPPVNAGIFAISSATANYTPSYGSVANTYNGNWPAINSGSYANPNCVELDTQVSSSNAITYDLGTNRTIGNIYLAAQGTPYGYMYPSVAFSTDNVTYNSSFTIGLGNDQNIKYGAAALSPTVTARYVRLTNGGGNNGTSTGDRANMVFCQIAFGP